MFVLHEGEVVKAQTEASSDMEFVVTFDLLEMPPVTGELRMTPEQLNAWRIIPRLLMFAMIGMTYRTVEWFMSLPDPNPEQAALVSVMTGALTGAFGLFLGKKE